MRRNLIVTCGTSQIQKQKISDEKKRGQFENFCRQKLNDFGENFEAPDRDFLYRNGEFKNWAVYIAKLCEEKWPQRYDMIGKRENVLGAEISTLVGMEKEAGPYYWDPKSDQITLIASQSKMGLFAARVIAQILVQVWKVSKEEQVNVRMVPGLNPETEDPDQAMYNLAMEIGKSLQKNETTNDWENIFVGSGGFKSTLPLLTIYSFMFGIKLIYTFEFSSHLQLLSPRVASEDSESRRFWQKTLNDLSKQKWMDQERQPSLYLQYIMDFRKEHPTTIF